MFLYFILSKSDVFLYKVDAVGSGVFCSRERGRFQGFLFLSWPGVGTAPKLGLEETSLNAPLSQKRGAEHSPAGSLSLCHSPVLQLLRGIPQGVSQWGDPGRVAQQMALGST